MNKINNQIIGKWELIDTIKSKETFNLNKRQNTCNDPPFKDVYFMPNGEKYWIFEGWENNKLFVHYGGDDPILCFEFCVENIKNCNFMFLNAIDYNSNSFVMVLKQVDRKIYEISDIKKTENINYDFVIDNKILGEWKTVSYVKNIEDFVGEEYNQQLWLEKIIFKPNGTVTRKYFDTSWEDKWTKGKLLDQKKQVVSNYAFKTINNKEFMFLEWKMGNYVYGGSPAEYYVFVKNN